MSNEWNPDEDPDEDPDEETEDEAETEEEDAGEGTTDAGDNAAQRALLESLVAAGGELGLHQRQDKAQKDAGFPAIGIGDLAYRIRGEKPAQPDQADRKARQARGAGEADDHERAKPISERHPRAGEGLRKREQRDIAFDKGGDPDDSGPPGGLISENGHENCACANSSRSSMFRRNTTRTGRSDASGKRRSAAGICRSKGFAAVEGGGIFR